MAVTAYIATHRQNSANAKISTNFDESESSVTQKYLLRYMIKDSSSQKRGKPQSIQESGRNTCHGGGTGRY
jgi:hypothetical protein